MSSINSAIGGLAVRVPLYTGGGNNRSRLKSFGAERSNQTESSSPADRSSQTGRTQRGYDVGGKNAGRENVGRENSDARNVERHHRPEHAHSHAPQRQRPYQTRTNETAQSQQPTSVERTRSKSIAESATLSLTVTTAEGDTVELSVEAQSLRQSEKTFARNEDGVTKSQSRSKQESVASSITVNGDLNDEELADIQQLLDSIGSGGGHKLADTQSLNSYDYSLTRSREVSVSTVAVYG